MGHLGMEPKLSKTFKDLGVPSAICDVLTKQNIIEPFEIQAKVIADVLAGRDILAKAPTGSGKTLGFGIPTVVNLKKGKAHKPSGLILSPTRELAEQIKKDLDPIAAVMDRRILSVYGGTGFNKQLRGLRSGIDLLVACPGRLLDLMNQKEVSLENVQIVVLDEADRMADMGFLPDVRKIVDKASKNRQTLLFSATLDHDVKVLTKQYQNNPVTHEVKSDDIDIRSIPHLFYEVTQQSRLKTTAHFASEFNASIIFCRTKHGTDRLARQLKRYGIKGSPIHGGRSQNQRNRALQEFTDGKSKVLVATDVASRGIHVDGVDCVIHFDPPADEKDYLHRSGRTARAGAKGTVISLIQKPQTRTIQKMMRKIDIDFFVEKDSDLDIDLIEIERPHQGEGSNTGQNKRSPNRNSKSRSSKPRNSRSRNSDSKPGSGNNRSKPTDNDEERSVDPRKRKAKASPTRHEGRKSRAKNRSEDPERPKSKRTGKKRMNKMNKKRRPRPANRD